MSKETKTLNLKSLPKTLNLYQKLGVLQSAIKGLSKDAKSHNYGYVSGNKLLSFIKPLMDDNCLLLKTEVLSIENVRQDYQGKYAEKNEILSKVMMRFTWIDTETGDKDENLFGANGQNGWDKGVGSALTYGERYFLMKYFHVQTDADDIDNPEIRPEEDAKPLKKDLPPLTKEGYEYLLEMGNDDEIRTALTTRKIHPKHQEILKSKIGTY